MLKEQLLEIARANALKQGQGVGVIGYLPINESQAKTFEPHEWAINAMNEAQFKAVHSEVHKLARIMGREFGDSVESFLNQYATQINNDFNNPSK